MANVIKLRKGLDINLKGKAAETYTTVKEPGFYALVPDDFPGVTPKVVVKEQEYVMAGGPLFIDKYHPEVKFVSPVSGVVTSVERGARRKVLNIVVEAAAEQDYEEFGKKNVSSMDAEAVKSALLEAGLFAFIKQRPYDIIADPTVTPKGIFVSAFDTNPLAPDFEFALKGEEANFQTGLDALAKLAKTYLSISVKQKAAALTQAKNVTITAFDGPNPAGNVGVQINHLDPVSKGETVWTIDPQAVIFIGRLFNTGRVNFTRTVAVTGSEVLKPAYCKLQVGALLTNVFAGNVTKDRDLRYISGNVLSGKQVSPNGFLGAFHSQLTVIPEGDDIHEMLGWIMPRFNQFSANHSYFSWLMGKKEYTLDARIKGGERHMIMSGEYDKVFPMDILPEYLIKAIIAGDIARMEAPTRIGPRILLSRPDPPWEQGDHIALQEGPSALRHGDDLFIVYSTRGSWSRHYKLGQLRLRTPDSDPLNPASWIKSGPIFTGNDRIHGVGHASFTTSPDGNEYWIYYHSKKDTVHNWGRDVRLQRFDFDATGNPRFGEPAEPGPYPMPSGTPKHAN